MIFQNPQNLGLPTKVVSEIFSILKVVNKVINENLVDFESKLQDIQDKIKQEEVMFRNWNVSNEQHRAKIRNEAATKILNVKEKPKLETLKQPKLKKIRYLKDPVTNETHYFQGKVHEIPAFNMSRKAVPSIHNIPKNNYDDWGHHTAIEEARISFNKQRIEEALKTRNMNSKLKKRAPATCRKNQ